MPPRSATNQQLADRLLDEGRVEGPQHERILEYAVRKNVRTEEAVLDLELMSEQELLKFIATLHKTQFVSTERLSRARLDPQVLEMVSRRLADHHGVFPLLYDREQQRLVVATADPDDATALKEVKLAAGVASVRAMVARPEAIRCAIKRGYDGDRRAFRPLLSPRRKRSSYQSGLLPDPFLGRADTGAPRPSTSPRHDTPSVHLEGRGTPPPARRTPSPARQTGRGETPSPARQSGRGEAASAARQTGRGETPSPARQTGRGEAASPARRTGRGQVREEGAAARVPDRPPTPRPDTGAHARVAPPPAPTPRPRRPTPPRGSELPGASAAPPGAGEDWSFAPMASAEPGASGRPDVSDAAPPSGDDAAALAAPAVDGRRTAAFHRNGPRAARATGRAAMGGGEALRRDGERRGLAPNIPATRVSSGPSRGPIEGGSALRSAALDFAPPSHSASKLAISAAQLTTSAPFTEAMRVLVGLLESAREELRGHSALVARLTLKVAQRIRLGQDHAQALVVASYLHDLGKMGDEHLTALNVSQFEAHRMSAQKLWSFPASVMESVGLHEHTIGALNAMYEQVGGGGFPQGLSGKDIPIGARILAITDTYADLTQNPANLYEQLLSTDAATDVLRELAGKVFDTNIVEVLAKCVGGERLLTQLVNRPSVLIVDPEPEESMALQLRLAEQGFDITLARRSDEGRAALMARNYAVVLCEVDLEEPDAGLFLREELQSTESGREIGWVFLSGRPSRVTARRAFSLDVDDFITKPFSTEVVVAKLIQLVRKRQNRAPPRGVSGSLSEMGLAEIVQVLWHGRKTCALFIESGDKKGEIHFNQGHIVGAKFGDATAEKAFFRMAALREEGRFHVDPQFTPGEERTIHASAEALLLESMRLLDEGAIP